jgi:hypothetical protein
MEHLLLSIAYRDISCVYRHKAHIVLVVDELKEACSSRFVQPKTVS